MMLDKATARHRLGASSAALVTLGTGISAAIYHDVFFTRLGDMLFASTVTLFAANTVFRPGADHTRQTILVAVLLVVGHVTRATFVRLFSHSYDRKTSYRPAGCTVF